MYGWVGNFLRIDLTKKKIKKEPIPKEWLRPYLGGSGFGARLLWNELKPGIDPLGPDNKLLFLTGPYVTLPCGGNSLG